MIKAFLRIGLITLIVLSLCFRIDEFIYVKTIPANVTFLTSDILGNFYVVQKNLLTKYDENGNIINTYDSKNKGEITSVDVSNPLKILVYYKDFNQIVFLDNTMSITGSPILLEELGISQSSFACTSYGNAFWVFDNTLSRLVRFDKNLVVQNQSDNLAQATNLSVPSLMIEKNGSLYISSPNSGIFIFDKYGTYNKTLPIKDVESFQIIDNKLFYQSTNIIKNIDLSSYEENNIALPEIGASCYQLNKKMLYIATKTGISIYKTKQNQ